MMNKRWIEVLVGVFVAAGFAALFMLSMKVSNISAFNQEEGYMITARFDNIGGLKAKAPVRIGGVRIGRVLSIDYDNNKLEAVVKMVISGKYNRLPDDSTANIYTAGLLGEQYVGLEPGGSDEFLKDGSMVAETQSAFVLERMIGKFLLQSNEATKAK
jgi:phospholipid/cholesterol/gamma-HCH transport system substrate-binding protein